MIAGESMTKEYIGRLKGGPNDGMHVEASVDSIPVKIITEMWLDGNKDDKDVNQEVTYGYYTWQGGYFSWSARSQTWYKVKKEED